MPDPSHGNDAHSDATIRPGSVIGPYTLLQQLGEGGMGEVWEAEQREPIRRHVALKLLKRGLDTKAFLARFEIERQALAVMDHPNIASVLDAGATAGGRPYYVMELVRGAPITTFCDNNRLTTRQRLELFCVVCRAVQHAHQKGVIHRDLKPSNVLVLYVDDVPVPKVIDFGIAKAMSGQFTDVTYVTEIGHPLGTPAYMSPEQWEPGQIDIDTRSDIYSLGVMLYELLVGRLPTDPKLIMRVGAAIAQLLRDVTPQAPSTRARSLGGEMRLLARARSTDPRSLIRELKGDLDWIILKAMEADRSRRYETAHALGLDIARHLQDEPVLARPPSLRYRAGRFVRRNRVGMVVASVVVLAVLGFTALTVVQARRLAVERDRAMLEAERAGALNDFLQETLLSPDPIDGFGRHTTMLEALDSASARLDRTSTRRASVTASMAGAIGWAYFKLGEFDRAEPLLRRALVLRRSEAAVDSAALAESLVRAAAMHQARARHDSAATLYAEALPLLRRQPRATADLAAALVRAGDFFRTRGDSSPARSAFAEARELYQRLNDSAGIIDVEDNRGALEYELGNREEAAALLRSALAYRRAHLGEHPLVASSLANLGAVLEDLDQVAAADSAYREALGIAERTLGPEHELVSSTLNNLGLLLSNGERTAEAERLLRRALAIDERHLGREHPAVGIDLSNLARLLCRTGKPAEGEALARRAGRIFTRDSGADSWQVALARTIVGRCLTAAGRYPDAERELTAGIRQLSASLGTGHWRVDTARVRLKELYLAWGKPQLADSVGK